MANIRIISVNFVMLSQVVINQGNFALQNRAENVVQTVVHCFSIISTNKLKINKITPLSQGPLGSQESLNRLSFFVYMLQHIALYCHIFN